MSRMADAVYDAASSYLGWEMSQHMAT
jgi:hypothetical protein